jgi:hypothetical protein
MIKAWTFRIVLLGMAIAAAISAFAEYDTYRAFTAHGAPARLERGSTAQAPGAPMRVGAIDMIAMPVKYRTAEGQEIVSERGIPVAEAQRLIAGEGVDIIYAREAPHRFIYRGEQLPSGAIWLGLSVFLFAVFGLSLRLRHH